MHHLVEFFLVRLEVRDFEPSDALHGLEERRVRAEAAAELQVFPQLLQRAEHTCTIEALALAVFAKAHRGTPLVKAMPHYDPRRSRAATRLNGGALPC